MTRREGEPYVVQEGDPLPQREKLYKLGNSLAASGEVILFSLKDIIQEGNRQNRGLRLLDTSEVLE